MFSAMFKKAKSQDFPVECRAMFIYENKDADNWEKENCIVRPDNYISNDINAFIEAIHKCAETNPAKEVSPEVDEVMKAFPEGIKVI